MTTPEPAEGAPIVRTTKPAPNPEWEAKAKAYHDEATAEAGIDPFATLTMLERWKSDAEPANEHGQVTFSRAMLDSAADALRHALEIARNEYLRAERLSSALRPFDAFAEYIGNKPVTLAGATIQDDKVHPDDEIATIGDASGFCTLRAKHFEQARIALGKGPATATASPDSSG